MFCGETAVLSRGNPTATAQSKQQDLYMKRADEQGTPDDRTDSEHSAIRPLPVHGCPWNYRDADRPPVAATRAHASVPPPR